MSEVLLPVLYTLFVWWFSTGVILYLDGLPRWTFKWTMLAATVLLAVALVGLSATADDTRTSGAYLAFTCALVVWGWKETAFLMGYVTGPRRTACPPAARGWQRVGYAVQAVMYHELALLALLATVVALTWGQPNQVGSWTFATLWVMRLSAKLNVFLGVRNLNEEFLPENLRYLESYFTRRSMNGLFPVSIAASLAIAVPMWQIGVAQGATTFAVTAWTFVATLLSLAILEHALMMLPLPSQLLWRWGMRSREDTARRA